MMGGNYFLLPWSCGFKFNWEQQKHSNFFYKCWSSLVEKVQQNSRLFFNHFGQVAKWAFLRMHQGHKLCKVW